MDVSFALPQSGSWATPEILRRVAVRAEELGYRSLWTFQRLLHPEDPDALAKVYRSVLDPVAALSAMSTVTRHVRLGLGVLNMPFVSPVLMAKQLTTLDILSNGRVDVGLGLGWSQEEFIASGASSRRRGARAEEFLSALRTLWTDDVSAFQGEFYTIPSARMDPPPAQSPHPPVLLGGTAEPSLRRAGRLADGWISSSRADLTRIGQSIYIVQDAAAAAGRDADTLRFVCRAPVLLRDAEPASTTPMRGPVDKIRNDLAHLRSQGVTEVFLDPNYDPEIGHPNVDPERSLHVTERILEAFG